MHPVADQTATGSSGPTTYRCLGVYIHNAGCPPSRGQQSGELTNWFWAYNVRRKRPSTDVSFGKAQERRYPGSRRGVAWWGLTK